MSRIIYYTEKGVLLLSIFTVFILFSACGSETKNDDSNKPTINKTNPSGLTDFQLENGIGPVKKKLNLGPINKDLANEGSKIFDSKCASCHKLDERYTGPAQRNVLQRISPEFFLNMVLNPDENIEKHPHIKKMLAEYMNKMTFQNVTMKDALAILEYFRVLDEELQKSKNQSN